MHSANLFMEKRVHPRVSVRIPVQYRLIEEQSEIDNIKSWRQTQQRGQTIDVSLGGMAIAVDKPIGVGSLLRGDIILKGLPNPLNVYAEVVWANETGAGLSFIMVKEKDIEILKDFLEKAAS